jgi:hypothetical protein
MSFYRTQIIMKSFFFTINGIVLATLLFTQQGEAHGTHFSIEKEVDGNTVELSYDNLEINTSESFDFHSALMRGIGTSEWDFVPYDRTEFEMQQSGKTLYTKTFYSDRLGFGGYTFPEGGNYDLLIRFMSGSALVLETSFSIQVKDTGPAIEYGRNKRVSRLGTSAVVGVSLMGLIAIVTVGYFLYRRRSS